MKKFLLMLICSFMLISACGKNNSQDKKETNQNQEYVKKLEETISIFYINLLQDVNKIERPKPIAKIQNRMIGKGAQQEQNSLSESNNQGSNDQSSSSQGGEQSSQGQSSQQQGQQQGQQQNQQQSQQGGQQGGQSENPYDKIIEKSYLALKEIYESWNQIRIRLNQSGALPEDTQKLDEYLNEMGYHINSMDFKNAKKSANESMFMIAKILDSYGQSKDADMIRLSYYINAIENDADNFALVNQITEDINKVLDSIEKSNAQSNKDKIVMFRLAIESIKNATKFEDAQLIRLKTDLLRDDVKMLKTLAGE